MAETVPLAQTSGPGLEGVKLGGDYNALPWPSLGLRRWERTHTTMQLLLLYLSFELSRKIRFLSHLHCYTRKGAAGAEATDAWEELSVAALSPHTGCRQQRTRGNGAHPRRVSECVCV